MEDEWQGFRLVVAAAILVFELAACQMLFLLVQEKRGLDVREEIAARVAREVPPDSKALLGLMSDLSRAGEVRCFQFSEGMQVIRPWSEKNCESSPWWLGAASVDMEVLGAEGKVWQLRFRSRNPRIFYVALWLTRVLVAFSVLGIIRPRFQKKETIVQRKIGP